MELWLLISGWLTESKHLLSDPEHIKLRVSTLSNTSWIMYKESYIIMIQRDHVVVMPPTTEHFTIHASDPTFWHKLMAAIDRCIEEK